MRESGPTGNSRKSKIGEASSYTTATHANIMQLLQLSGLVFTFLLNTNKQDAVFIGSDSIDSYFDALSANCLLPKLLSECSPTAYLILAYCLKIWARMMMIDKFEPDERTKISISWAPVGANY